METLIFNGNYRETIYLGALIGVTFYIVSNKHLSPISRITSAEGNRGASKTCFTILNQPK